MTLGSDTDQLASSYYPPRARWYNRHLFSGIARFRRLLHLEQLRLPRGYSFQQFLLSIVLPGYAFLANGRRVLGWCFMGAYFAAATLFIVALGYREGNIGYGLMISAHTSSLIFLESDWLRRSTFGFRFGLAVVTLLTVWLVVYSPVMDFAQRHWLMPMQIRGEVVIVRRWVSSDHVERGDRILYSIKEAGTGGAHEGGGAVVVLGGYGFGPVLALPGDRVVFSANSYSINGIAHPLLPHMPASGEVIVAEKQWFIWPEFDINIHGNMNGANITAMMLQLAPVSENQFVGKPFKSWFGRRTTRL